MNKERIFEKILTREKTKSIELAVREKLKPKEGEWLYLIDTDFEKSEAYVELYGNDVCKYYSVNFVLNSNGLVESLGELTEVIQQTNYVIKAKEEITKTVIEKVLGYFKKDNSTPFVKQFDEEQMIAIEPLYIEPDGVDGHGWTASADVLKQMTESCDKAIQEGRLKAKYNHKEETTDFTFIKAFVSEFDCMIGDTFIPEGQPIIKVQFTNKEAWEKRKSGEICGVSIGAKGSWETINE